MASSVHDLKATAKESLMPHGEHLASIPRGSLGYLAGFGSEFASEALPGALPVGQNSPQICPYGLYAEQLSGTAFTVPRARNQRTWFYRIRPSVVHDRFIAIAPKGHLLGTYETAVADPNQMRWKPHPFPRHDEKLDFVDGLATMMGAGDPTSKSGMAIHNYACNASMVDTAIYNSDGDFLIVPQEGTLHIQTEMGLLDVAPKEIAVIQRGIRFRVDVDGPSRGYICEIFDGHFQLPDLGPIGSNGLANSRDFLTPKAHFEDRDVDYVLVNKFGGHLFSTLMHHSPFDVVAWHGNYAPYKYNLELFNTMNSVSFDHPDPSIYTVLTCPTASPGVALCDFVVFPPRWMVMEHTFRPPWFHRNYMTEYMGMIWGKYDAKSTGFLPGGASLHSCMTSHGPDSESFLKASTAHLSPDFFQGGLAFMFETTMVLKVTPWALHASHRDTEYQKCWQTIPRFFDPAVRDVKALVVKPHASASDSAGCVNSASADVAAAEEEVGSGKRKRETSASASASVSAS